MMDDVLLQHSRHKFACAAQKELKAQRAFCGDQHSDLDGSTTEAMLVAPPGHDEILMSSCGTAFSGHPGLDESETWKLRLSSFRSR